MSKIPGLENLTILSESDYCILYRGMSSADNTPVICKALKSPPPHNYLLPRFHNEFELWRKIESDGVLKVYGWHHTDGVSAFLVEDFDGLPLSEISDLESYPLETQLQMALQLTKALGDIHKHNVVFTNLALHNILYDSITRQVKIADFSRARQLPVSHLQPSIPLSHRSLPYISPEQTGRTNRSQDHRSDFYSLGICLYRIITGTLPFTAVDPVEYIHHHVAQPAPFAHQAYDGIPKMLSKIIHKLMEKSAESRYQSTKGILHDLKLCLSSLQELGTVPSFQLGKEDISEIFQLPERLYGRDKETAIILENLNSIIGSKGKILFISGVSGIGKSSLVNSLKGPAASQAGYFLSGKFDQAPSEVPYSPILSALSDFISQILAEGEHSADRLKRRVLKALGNRGSIITQVIPEAEFLLGEQPPLPPLSAKENEQRFSTTLSAFIQACCSRNSPLILFLDDMQWADSGTLSFIEKYLLKLPASGIFILGTFRSNEVADSHPLHLAISKIRQKKIPLPILHLQPLTHEDVTALVADALYTTPEKVYQLAEICLKKTGGNPFFVRQFLTKAHHLKNIWYSPADGEWLWNERDVSIMDSTDNLLPLQKRQLAALKEDQLKILKFAACLGNSFDLKTLQAVTGEPEEKIVKTLHQVSGIINGIATPAAIIGPNSGIPHSPKFAFSHDRLQRAAYSLLTSEEITTTHYLIGTRLLALGDDSNEFARVLGITGHLNIGADMIHDEREKYSLAKMNLKAGKKAMISAASHSALNFFHAGLRLLPAEAWLKEYELTFSLHSCCAEAAYMSKNYGLTNQLFSAAMANCNNLLERTRLYSTKIKALKAQNKSSEAVQCGREILAQFDIHLSHKPSKLKALLAFLRIRRLLAGLKTADIKQLPPVSNPHISAVLSLLTDIGTATYYTSSSLLPEIALKAIELALKHGHSIDSALMGFTTYGFLECGLPFGRIETGYSYGMISLEMYGKGAPQSHPQIPYLVHNLISHWKYPVSMTAAEM